MADFDNLNNLPESSSIDNDFEKLEHPDQVAPSDIMADFSEDNLVSSTQRDESSEPSPLVDLGFETKPVIPDVSQPSESVDELKPEKESNSGSKWVENVDPRVLDLIYWRDIKKTGIVFGSMMVLLLSLALFSVLSVIAYLSLAGLTVTTTFVLYKKVLAAVQKTGDGHPFKQFLDIDIALPEERVQQLAEVITVHGSCTIKELRRLFLVEDLVDSLKFGLLLWVLTYIGAWFNGMTLIILGMIAVFTLPKVYETYQVPIDNNIDLVKTKIKNVVQQLMKALYKRCEGYPRIQEKIPLPGKKKKSE